MSTKTFNQLTEDLGDINNLDDLFKKWQEAHKAEYYDSFIKTSPIPIPEQNNNIKLFKNSFLYDGITSIEGKVKDCTDTTSVACKTLFVLKESNASDSIDNWFFRRPDKTNFWFNEKTDDAARKKYCNIFEEYINRVSPGESHFGYMNVNKRGGVSKTDPKRLDAYLKAYLPFVLKEIELINPEYIFICGFFDRFKNILYKNGYTEIGSTNWKGIDENEPRILKINGKGHQVFHITHPSSWRQESHKKSMEAVTAILNK